MTRQKLTEKQRAIYEFIRNEITENSRSPTVREIGEQFGIRSTNGIICHLRALERKKWIERDLYLSRGISLIPEIKTQFITLSPGEAGVLGEVYVGCVGVDKETGTTTIELIAPDTYGELRKDT